MKAPCSPLPYTDYLSETTAAEEPSSWWLDVYAPIISQLQGFAYCKCATPHMVTRYTVHSIYGTNRQSYVKLHTSNEVKLIN